MTWAREKAGLTKRALARQIGISEQLMGEIESGWRSATPANLRRIAVALNCPVVLLERKRHATTPGPATGRQATDGGGSTEGAGRPIPSEGPGHPVTASVLLTDARGRVLIVHRARPGGPWALPGGRVEAGESPLDAARREVREALGIEVDLRPQDLMAVEWLEATRPARRARLAFVFAGPCLSRADTRCVVLPVSELDAWTWAARDAALEILHPRTADRIRGPHLTAGSTLYRETRNVRNHAR